MSDVGQDSSMEDILASIKRVIADDVRPAPPRGGGPRAAADESDDDDILELDESLMQYPAQAQFGQAPAVGRAQAQPAPDAALVSPSALEATRNSLATLSALRSPGASALPGDGGPLEAVVRDMLRPMLKDWLDQRLPAIVEELVAKEVARITGRG